MKKENKKAHLAALSKEDYHQLTGFKGDWRDTWWNDEFLGMMARQWKLEQVQSVLDVGCGVGHWGQRLMRHLSAETHLHGIDPEAEWVKGAHERATKLGIGNRSTYQVGAAESLPFADESFDMVTCQTVLIHVEDMDAAIKEMIRVLKPGGLFLCAEPNNLGSTAGSFVDRPLLDWSQISDLLELEYRCTQGKFKVGQGHQSAGQVIPAALLACGWKDIHVNTNNQCALLAPPYTDLGAKNFVQLMRDTYNSGAAMVLGGTRENCQRFYLAGGGDPDKFSNFWDLARLHLQKKIEKIDEGTYVSPGGYIHYLVWGHKEQ
ncbi:MAG: class I SAM-dependent methyltransferase [Bacteroidota bacterium]